MVVKTSKYGKESCRHYAFHLQVNYKESITQERSLVICSSEVFYIPRQFVGDSVDLVGLVGNFEIHNKVSVPMLFVAMDSPVNTMIYKAKGII